MKLFSLALLFCLGGMSAQNRQLLQARSVYILPMGSGMDQFLANRLTHFGKMQVVANPQQADAILTDRLGEPFEKKLDELYPPLEEKEAKDAKDAKDEKDTADEASSGIDFKNDAPARATSFGRGRGTFFLVDRKTRNVLWSTYERPKNSSADELNRTAERVINSLKRDLKPGLAADERR